MPSAEETNRKVTKTLRFLCIWIRKGNFKIFPSKPANIGPIRCTSFSLCLVPNYSFNQVENIFIPVPVLGTALCHDVGIPDVGQVNQTETKPSKTQEQSGFSKPKD